jgi:hypothetical protein
MTPTLHLFVVMLALVLFALAGLGIPEPPRLRFATWGLFLWLLSTLLR